MKTKKTSKTKKSLKTKKAVKRLDRVEALLSKVIDQYPADEREVRELLDSARASVIRARAKTMPEAKASSPGKTKAGVKAKSKGKGKTPAKAKTPRKAQSKATRLSTAPLEEAIDRRSATAAVAVTSV